MMASRSLAFLKPTVGNESGLMARAVAGVLMNAQEGELPLFAWTLGLPQSSLLGLVSECFPKLGRLDPMPEPQYAAIMNAAPPAFHDLADMLLAGRSADADEQHAHWLAHTIAAASFGSRHLWKDLALEGREAVSSLLACYFQPLWARNTRHLRWKHFFFAELGVLQGNKGLRPPECGNCDQFPICFKV